MDFSVLTLKQPAIGAVFSGKMNVLNRSFNIDLPSEGKWILLHASKTSMTEYETKKSRIRELCPEDVKNMPHGVILGAVHIIDCLPADRVNSQWAVGPYCWIVDQYHVLRNSVPAQGKLSLWKTESGC